MVENEILKLFPDPVLKYKLDDYKNFNKELEIYIYNLYEEDKKGIERSNRGGWHSKNFNLLEKNSIQKKVCYRCSEIHFKLFSEYGVEN